MTVVLTVVTVVTVLIVIAAMTVIETEIILVVMLLVAALLWVTENVLLGGKPLLPAGMKEMADEREATVDPLYAVQPGEELRGKGVVLPRVTGEPIVTAIAMIEMTETT